MSTTFEYSPAAASGDELGVHLIQSEHIREGVPFGMVDRLLKLLPITQKELARALSISERTLARRKREGRFTQEESDRLVRLMDLLNLTYEAFDRDWERAAEWFVTPKTMLDDEAPLYRADTRRGAKEVEDMLAVITYTMAA